MALCCAISNEVPETPVVSPASGAIFEKRLVVQYIKENGTDPINGQELHEDQLIEIKTPPISKPKPPSATSIPAILKALQDEWDAVMLSSFTLRQQLQTARQELSHSLYQHDAACRVIARLNKEVTAAREALATLKPQSGQLVMPSGGGGDDSAAADEGLTPELIAQLEATAQRLTSERKQRSKRPPEQLTSADEMRQFRCIRSHVGLHSAGQPGILCLDLAQDDTRIVTGGVDKNVVVFDRETEQVHAVLKGHSKRVTRALFITGNEDTVASSSLDSTVRIWHVPTGQTQHILRGHSDAVTGLSLHATGDLLLSCGRDGVWALNDVRAGRVLVRVRDSQPLTCAQFHPDGLILAAGTEDSLIKVWDVKQRSNVANFPGHSGPVSALAFSENGYYLATAAEDALIKLWDLRKLKNFKTLTLDERQEIRHLEFDQSGSYLAVAGTDVRLYLVKQWELLSTFSEHTATATGVRFGSHAGFLVSASMDRSVKVYGAPEQE